MKLKLVGFMKVKAKTTISERKYNLWNVQMM